MDDSDRAVGLNAFGDTPSDATSQEAWRAHEYKYTQLVSRSRLMRGYCIGVGGAVYLILRLHLRMCRMCCCPE